MQPVERPRVYAALVHDAKMGILVVGEESVTGALTFADLKAEKLNTSLKGGRQGLS